MLYPPTAHSRRAVSAYSSSTPSRLRLITHHHVSFTGLAAVTRTVISIGSMLNAILTQFVSYHPDGWRNEFSTSNNDHLPFYWIHYHCFRVYHTRRARPRTAFREPQGGAIYASSVTVTITASTFDSCIAVSQYLISGSCTNRTNLMFRTLLFMQNFENRGIRCRLTPPIPCEVYC